jgi:hypothetical protein
MRAVRSTLKLRFDTREPFSIPNPAGRISCVPTSVLFGTDEFWRIYNGPNMSAIFESTEYVMAELIRGVLKNALAVQLAVLRY